MCTYDIRVRNALFDLFVFSFFVFLVCLLSRRGVKGGRGFDGGGGMGCVCFVFAVYVDVAAKLGILSLGRVGEGGGGVRVCSVADVDVSHLQRYVCCSCEFYLTA